MELSYLRAFARIADLSSISAAARTIGAPKSTISRSLTRLEAELGAVLVDRSTRHLRLTDAGRLFRPYAQRILADVEEAAIALDVFGAAPRGTLRISAPLAVSVGLIAPMLPAFLDAHSEVRVVLMLDNRRIDMPVEDADLVIRVGVLADSDLIARRLLTSESWTCASPAYLAAKGAPLHVAELSGHRLIGYSEQPAAWSYRSADGAVERFDVPPGDAVSDSAALEPVLIGGAGIGRLPDFMAAPAVARGDLVRLFPQARGDALDIHALYPSHRSLSAKVRAFIDALHKHLETGQGF